MTKRTLTLIVDDIFGRFSSIQSTIEGIMLEMLANKYSLDEEYLKVEEMFVAKYEFAENKQSSLAAHQDGTPFSFVLTLNNPGIDFDGGGKINNKHYNIYIAFK